MAIWQFDFMLIPQGEWKTKGTEEQLLSWGHIEVPFDVGHFLYGFLQQNKSWSNSIKQFGDNDSTCIQLLYENNHIEEIRCRLDLRNLSRATLEKIIDFAQRLNGIVYYGGRIYDAKMENLVSLIKDSPAAKFCENPGRYLEQEGIKFK